MIIPTSALVEFAGAEKVWKVVDGETREQQVLTGERRADGIEILQGVNVGDTILLNGPEGMVARIATELSPAPGTEDSSDSVTTGDEVSHVMAR